MATRQDASTGEIIDDGEGQKDAATLAGSTVTMQVKVYSPFKVYFEGEAKSISAESATGPFDILPKHHNFITLLSPCELIVRVATGEPEAIRINGGIMHVKANDVIVFLDV